MHHFGLHGRSQAKEHRVDQHSASSLRLTMGAGKTSMDSEDHELTVRDTWMSSTVIRPFREPRYPPFSLNIGRAVE